MNKILTCFIAITLTGCASDSLSQSINQTKLYYKSIGGAQPVSCEAELKVVYFAAEHLETKLSVTAAYQDAVNLFIDDERDELSLVTDYGQIYPVSIKESSQPSDDSRSSERILKIDTLVRGHDINRLIRNVRVAKVVYYNASSDLRCEALPARPDEA